MLRVQEICKEQGVTLQQLAKRLDISYQALYANLSGNPTLSKLQAIADALNVRVVDLFEKNEDIRVFVEYRGWMHEISKSKIIQLIEDSHIPDHENIRGK